MYFSKISLNWDKAIALRYLGMQNEYGDHQILHTFFENKKREFVYRKNVTSNNWHYLVVSKQPPKVSDDLWIVETKEYNPIIKAGDYLRYNMKVSILNGKQDIVQYRLDELKKNGVEEDIRFVRQDAYNSYLDRVKDKFGAVFLLDSLVIKKIESVKFIKPNTNDQVAFKSYDLSGLLQVRDTDRFYNRLYTGHGQNRTWGCGLVMVRRV